MADNERPLQPGEKQPPHAGPGELAQETVDALRGFSDNLQATETYGPSSERAGQPGNLNPTPPHERERQRGPAARNPADIAAGAIAGATTAILANADAQKRIQSDPRHERDQRVYDMGQSGTLGLVPPTDAEVMTMAARAGVPEEALDSIPKSAQEQVADDMRRLDQAEQRASTGITGTAPVPGGAPAPIGVNAPLTSTPTTSGRSPTSAGATQQAPTGSTAAVGPTSAVRPSTVAPGAQEGSPPNNLESDARGRTVGGAEGEARKREEQKRADEANKKAQDGTVIK